MTRPNTFTLNSSNSLYSGLLAAYLGNGVTGTSGVPGNSNLFPDSGANGYNGSLSAYPASPWVQDSTLGRWGVSTEASGSAANITLATSPSLSGAWSMLCWVHFPSSATLHYYLGAILGKNGTGIGCGAGLGGYGPFKSPGNGTLLFSSWTGPGTGYYACLAMYDGSSTYSWYVNGTGYSLTGGTNSDCVPATALDYLMYSQSDKRTFFDCLVWGRVLTSTEIAAVSSQTNSALYTVGGSNLILPPATFNPSWAAANRQIGVY